MTDYLDLSAITDDEYNEAVLILDQVSDVRHMLQPAVAALCFCQTDELDRRKGVEHH